MTAPCFGQRDNAACGTHQNWDNRLASPSLPVPRSENDERAAGHHHYPLPHCQKPSRVRTTPTLAR
jgi:hypothetical protein